RLVLLDINRAGAEETAAAIASLHGPGRVLIEEANVADWESVSAAFSRISKVEPKLDILVNNAGMGVAGPAPDTPIEDWKRTIGVVLDGPFYCCKLGIPLIRAAGGGAIVNVASIAGIFGEYNLTAYGAAKG